METFLLLWNLWAGLFQAIPYGDPYLAVVGLFAVVLVAGRILRTVFN